MNNNLEEEFDFMSAIEAHIRWKVRLEGYIDGTSGEALEAETVRRDDQCALGCWIHGEGGSRYGSHPRFASMKDVHAEFHRSAGEIVRLVDQGDRDGARDILNRGAYAKASHQIKAQLARISLELEP